MLTNLWCSQPTYSCALSSSITQVSVIGASLSEPHHRRSTVKSKCLLACWLAYVIPYMDDSGLHTVQSNYNFTHTRYTSHVVHACFSVDREIITRVPKNSHVCKLNTHDSYTSCSHACDIYFLVLSACESRLVTQFYKSNATSALAAG